MNQKLPDHWMKDFFMGQILMEIGQHETSVQYFETLTSIFPTFCYMQGKKATSYYHLQGIAPLLFIGFFTCTLITNAIDEGFFTSPIRLCDLAIFYLEALKLLTSILRL